MYIRNTIYISLVLNEEETEEEKDYAYDSRKEKRTERNPAVAPGPHACKSVSQSVPCSVAAHCMEAGLEVERSQIYMYGVGRIPHVLGFASWFHPTTLVSSTPSGGYQLNEIRAPLTLRQTRANNRANQISLLTF